MSSFALSLFAFACILGCTLIGMVVSARLPAHHLSDGSKDTVKLGTALIATMAALVLGLLIASAKNHYDKMSDELEHISAKILQLDRVLAAYGPETMETRDILRKGVIFALQQGWPEDKNQDISEAIRQPRIDLQALQGKLLRLSPRDDVQRWGQARATHVVTEIADARWLLALQTETTSLPMLARVLLLSWLMFLFFSFGLFAPRNATVILVLFFCALSVAGACFLILELDSPYQGLIKLSSEPLRNTLAHLGK